MMDRRKMLLSSLVGSVGLAAQRLSADAQQTQGGPNPQRVTDVERAFSGTMAKRDLAGFTALISQEAIFMGAADAPRVLRGRQAIVDVWKQYFDGPDAPFSWEPDIVEVLDSGSMALSSGPVHDPKGEIIGRFNSIWRLEADGRWRIVFDRGAPICK
jgi:ketosteroid isomerase-like protein